MRTTVGESLLQPQSWCTHTIFKPLIWRSKPRQKHRKQIRTPQTAGRWASRGDFLLADAFYLGVVDAGNWMYGVGTTKDNWKNNAAETQRRMARKIISRWTKEVLWKAKCQRSSAAYPLQSMLFCSLRIHDIIGTYWFHKNNTQAHNSANLLGQHKHYLHRNTQTIAGRKKKLCPIRASWISHL